MTWCLFLQKKEMTGQLITEHNYWETTKQDSVGDLTHPLVSHKCQWTGLSLVPEMAYRLFGDEPLPAPGLVYCQVDPWEQTSTKFYSKFKCRLDNVGHFVSASMC